MSKYKIYRPFSIKRRIKSYLNPSNILCTLCIWVLLASIDLIKIIIMGILHDIRYIINFIHFRKIKYSYNKIINMIKEMSPRGFEIFIAELYKNMGYEVELTPPSCDGGKDIILHDDEGNTIYVECKHYSEANYVGREICQKLIGAMVMDKADEGIIVCTGKFHSNAWDVYSKVDNLQLVDLNGIMRMIKQINVYKLPRIFMKTMNIQDDLMLEI